MNPVFQYKALSLFSVHIGLDSLNWSHQETCAGYQITENHGPDDDNKSYVFLLISWENDHIGTTLKPQGCFYSFELKHIELKWVARKPPETQSGSRMDYTVGPLTIWNVLKFDWTKMFVRLLRWWLRICWDVEHSWNLYHGLRYASTQSSPKRKKGARRMSSHHCLPAVLNNWRLYIWPIFAVHFSVTGAFLFMGSVTYTHTTAWTMNILSKRNICMITKVSLNNLDSDNAVVVTRRHHLERQPVLKVWYLSSMIGASGYR